MSAKELIQTINEVEKEIKSKISKIGKDALYKKLEAGKLANKQEVTAALFYSQKRGYDLSDLDTTLSQYEFLSEKEKVVVKEKVKTKEVKKESKKKVSKKAKQVVQDNQILLTKNELDVLTCLVKLSKSFSTVSMESFEKEIEKKQGSISVRVKKGYLGAVVKKSLIAGYDAETIFLTAENNDTFSKIASGELELVEKKKYQRSNILTGRKNIEIEGKIYDKSRYIRKILREDVHATPKSINAELLSIGFPKMYHSELLRCKKHLNMK